MPTPELLDYIRQQHANGNSFDDIRAALIGAGWQSVDVEEALRQVRHVPHGLSLDSLGSLFHQVMAIYRQRWKPFVGILLISRGAMFLVACAGILVVVSVFLFSRDTGTALIIPLLILLFVCVMVSQLWESLALLDAITTDRMPEGVLAFFVRTKHRLASYAWLMVLQFVLTIGAFLLFVIPGIIFSVWFSFTSFIFLLENEKGMGAVLKSREYVRHLWWQVTWRIFLGGLCISLFSYGVTATPSLSLTPIQFFADPASMVSVGGDGTASASPVWMSLLTIGSSLVAAIVSLFLSPVITVYYFVLYRNVRALKGQIPVPQRIAPEKYYAVAVLGMFLIPLLMLAAMLFSRVPVRQSGKRMLPVQPTVTLMPWENLQQKQKTGFGSDFYARGRDARRLTDQKELASALKEYMADYGRYPATLSQLAPQYMQTIPTDPDGLSSYSYKGQQDEYQLCVPLELQNTSCIVQKKDAVRSTTIPIEQRTRDSIRRTDRDALYNALLRYHEAKGYYPDDLSYLVMLGEMRTIPTDPLTGQDYEYSHTVNEYGDFVEVCAELETTGRECMPAG